MCVNSSSTTALLATHLPPNLLPWWVWLCLLLGMQQVVLELHACTVCSHDNARKNTLFYFIFYRSPIIACVVMHNTSTFIMSLSQIQHCVHITSVGSLGCVDFLLSILRHVLFSYHTPHHVSIVTASSPPPPPPPGSQMLPTSLPSRQVVQSTHRPSSRTCSARPPAIPVPLPLPGGAPADRSWG